MLRIVLVTLFCAQAFARPSSDYPIESHIVGGTAAKDGQFPFAVAIVHTEINVSYCGGVLISDKYVLTTGRCVRGDQPNWLAIGAGSVNLTSQKLYKIDKIIIHPANNISSFYDDIALLRLSAPIPLGGNVQTIAYFTEANQLVGKNVTAMGWGFTSDKGSISPTLLYMTSSILSNDVCKKELAEEGVPVVPGQLCIKGELNRGLCHNDAGTPLYYKAPDGKSYVVGVASWGVGCARGFPDVFTRVSSYTKWIKDNMK